MNGDAALGSECACPAHACSKSTSVITLTTESPLLVYDIMSTFSSVRAASAADRKSAVANPDRHRPPYLSKAEDLRHGQRVSSLGVEDQHRSPQEKRAQAERYFANTRPTSNHNRDGAKADLKRGHSGRKVGSDAARGAHPIKQS